MKKSFLEGRTFTDLRDLNLQADAWVDGVANVRCHGTTHARPIDRFAQEGPALQPFTNVPVYDPRPVELRVVTSDSHISFGGVRYSVHPVAVGHTVQVRPDGEEPGARLTIHLGDQLVGDHWQAPRGSRDVTLAEHRVAIRECTQGRPPKAPRKGPRFVQLPQHSPEVEIRPLSVYDRFVEEVAG